jgi:5-(carboxyamino)imidazole ribonucleotide synthase
LKNYYSSDFKLGVLGGGQLGRMLLTETQKFDIHTSILDGNKNAPCAAICNTFVVGNLLDFDAVYNFGKTVDLLTIEIENVNLDALDKLELEGLTIYPKPKDLRIIQSKAKQKNFYFDNNIPTAPFSHFAFLEELVHCIENNIIDFPFVWKAARFGYDGNGVKIVRNFTDLESLPNVECITEQLIPFQNELAVIVAKNANGETTTYPVVEMEFHPEANQVEYVICPARIENTVAKKSKRNCSKTG